MPADEAPGKGSTAARGGPAEPPAREADRPPSRQAPGGAGRPGARRPAGGPWKTVAVLLAAVGIVAAVIWALAGSHLLVVRSVTVTGLHRVTRSRVTAAAGIRYGTPLTRVSTSAVRRRVETITQVQSAQVSRSWPDGIDIAVTERTPALAVRGTGGYRLVDPAGITVASVARRPPGTALFIPSGPVRGNPAVAAAAAVTRQLPAQISRRLVSVTAPAASDVTLHLAQGVTVFWGSSEQSAVKERTLAALMRTHARYYDVSMPGSAATR
jgi:cell division protein FtsQ